MIAMLPYSPVTLTDYDSVGIKIIEAAIQEEE
jgi:hypothetical protein